MKIKIVAQRTNDGCLIPETTLPPDTVFPYRHIDAEWFSTQQNGYSLLRFSAVRILDTPAQKAKGVDIPITACSVLEEKVMEPDRILWQYDVGGTPPVGTVISVQDATGQVIYEEEIVSTIKIYDKFYSEAIRIGNHLRESIHEMWNYILSSSTVIGQMDPVSCRIMKRELGPNTSVGGGFVVVDGFSLRFRMSGFTPAQDNYFRSSEPGVAACRIPANTPVVLISLHPYDDDRVYLACCVVGQVQVISEVVCRLAKSYMHEHMA